MKPSVILDVAFLGHERGVRRGAERVARHLFEGLRASGLCDLSYVATSHLAGAYEFLQSHGVPVDEKVHFTTGQLRRSRLARRLTNVVHRSRENHSFCARAGRRVLSHLSRLCSAGEFIPSADWFAQADIYHSPHTPFPMAVRENTGLRKFLTCHDFIPLKNPEHFPGSDQHFMKAVLDCLRPENFAFCVSETTRNDVLNYSSMPPEHVFVTPLAADPEVFHPVTDPAARQAVLARYGVGDEPYFLALSAHDPHKNFAHLVECFGSLIEAGELDNCNLVIVGPNPGRNAAVQSAMARFPRAASRMIIPGFVPDEDLSAIYSGALAFLFPSFAEGFGIPPLEAMQCGTPVIASNTTSMPEVIGDAGLLFPPSDRDAWCQAMLRVSHDAALRAELSQRSRARAALFSWARFTKATLHGYRVSLQET